MDWSGVLGKAQKQRGLISAEQAAQFGASFNALRWARRSHRLECFLPGVYMLTGTSIDWNVRAHGALLAAGPNAVLSHATAAALYGLPGFARTDETPIHVLLPMGERVRLPPGYEVHRSKRPFKSWRIHDEFTVTLLGRTVVDLAAIIDEERLEIALDAAHLRWHQLQTWLEREIKGLDPKRHKGVACLRDLLAVRTGPPAESPHETMIRRRMRQEGITGAVHQYNISDERGFIMRADEAFPGHKVAVHGDSYLWHGDRKAFDKDADQRTRLAALGWLSFEVTSTSVKTGDWPTLLKRALAEREPQLKLL